MGNFPHQQLDHLDRCKRHPSHSGIGGMVWFMPAGTKDRRTRNSGQRSMIGACGHTFEKATVKYF